jgi:hypothetical protein
MKYFKSVMLAMIFTITASAQSTIPVIIAENADNEYDFFQYNDQRGDDSWYNTGIPIDVKASSSLKNSEANTYNPINAHDFKLETAWVEGHPNQGIGESLIFIIKLKAPAYDHLTINGFRIANGYVKTKKLWQANSRVKVMTMLVDNSPYAKIHLNDFYGFQKVNFSDIKVPINKILLITFIIHEVYPGNKYSDTSISQIEFDGSGYMD